MGNPQPWRGGVVQAAALHARPWAPTPGHLTMMSQNTSTQLAVVWSSLLPPASPGSWLESRAALRQKRKQKPQTVPGRRVDLRMCCQLPSIVWCAGAVVPSPTLLLRINISTGLITRLVPGQLALACIWSPFLRCHTPIVLDCSLPQIRGWLHLPNPTATPRCLFVGPSNEHFLLNEKKKKSPKHTWAALESPACSDADRMFPSSPSRPPALGLPF